MVSSRIPAEIIAQIDEWAASHDTTRSDAIKRLVVIALALKSRTAR